MGIKQHISQGDHEQVRTMDASDSASRSARISLLAATEMIALDLRSRSSPLLTTFFAAERALGFAACSCFDLRDRFGFSPEIANSRLSIFDLCWVQLVKGIEKVAKILVLQWHSSLERRIHIG